MPRSSIPGAAAAQPIAAALLSADALAAFLFSRTTGIFGFTENGWQPAPQAARSVAAELVTVILCAASVLLYARARR